MYVIRAYVSAYCPYSWQSVPPLLRIYVYPKYCRTTFHAYISREMPRDILYCIHYNFFYRIILKRPPEGVGVVHFKKIKI